MHPLHPSMGSNWGIICSHNSSGANVFGDLRVKIHTCKTPHGVWRSCTHSVCIYFRMCGQHPNIPTNGAPYGWWCHYTNWYGSSAGHLLSISVVASHYQSTVINQVYLFIFSDHFIPFVFQVSSYYCKCSKWPLVQLRKSHSSCRMASWLPWHQAVSGRHCLVPQTMNSYGENDVDLPKVHWQQKW